MLKRSVWLIALGCLFAGTVWATDDPFVGEWKVNPSKTKLTEEMRVESVGGNKYAVYLGGATTETIAADGTDQPGDRGTTLSVSVLGQDSWKVVRKKDGRTLLTAYWMLSTDGNTLTDDYTEFGPNGSSSTVKYLFARTAGKAGFEGTWDTTIAEVNPRLAVQVRPYEGDGLSFITPQNVTTSLKFDGNDYPIVGPNVPSDAATSGRRLNERTLEMTYRIGGKITATRQVELSSDLKTLTITEQPAGRSQPNILVFERQ